MFQFSRLAAQTYGLGLRLFGNLRIKACLTTPRSFSQFSAPFKAFRRQDVPHALFLRLIAPIHHSLRNAESACSLFCQYTIGTFFRLLAKPKKQTTKPTAPFPTRSTRAPSYSRQNSEECNVFRVFLLSLYKVIELNEFDKIIVMFLRSAAQPTYAPAPFHPLTLTANASNSARTVDKRQNPRRHSCIT